MGADSGAPTIKKVILQKFIKIKESFDLCNIWII